MFWNFKLLYHSSSIQEIEPVLRSNARFLKFSGLTTRVNAFIEAYTVQLVRDLDIERRPKTLTVFCQALTYVVNTTSREVV